MLTTAQSENIPVILGTLPIATFLPPEKEPPVRNIHFLKATIQSFKNRWQLALSHARLLIQAEPESAWACYLIAECYQHLGEREEAKSWYMKAIEYDSPLGGRCPYSRNQLIRKTAEKYHIVLADIAQSIAKMNHDISTQNTLFQDHCHIYPQYYKFVTLSIFQAWFTLMGRKQKQGESHYPTLRQERLPMESSAPLHTAPIAHNAATSEEAYRLLIQSMVLFYHVTQDFPNLRVMNSVERALTIQPDIYQNLHQLQTELTHRIQNGAYWSIDLNNFHFARQWAYLSWHMAMVLHQKENYHAALRLYDALDTQPVLMHNGYFFLWKALLYMEQNDVKSTKKYLARCNRMLNLQLTLSDLK